MTKLLNCLLAAMSFFLAACAADPVPAAVSTNALRVLVKVVQSGSDTERIVRDAANASRVEVSYVAAVSPQWHALQLSCADQATCNAALERLRNDVAHFEAVQLDERRRLQLNSR